jgi:drug/metabolite transporter (DMT)-like permease
VASLCFKKSERKSNKGDIIMGSLERRHSHRFPDLEYEKGYSDDDSTVSSARLSQAQDSKKLLLVFAGLVVFGSLNAVFGKLQAVPMYNYPNFLNLFGVALYVPICFSYIIPVAKFGLLNNAISPEQLALTKRPFAIMGFLDCMASLMQVFASVYLPGPLLVLLPQAAIPISMILSGYLLGQKYRAFQYVGAVIVLSGIVVVLEPMISHRHAADFVCVAIDVDRDCSICQVEINEEMCLSHRLDIGGDELSLLFESQRDNLWANMFSNATGDDDEGQPICSWTSSSASSSEELLMLIWSCVMILSCIPMTLSSIYKEIALGDELDLDPIYMNGWIAIFQLLFSLLLAIPAGFASSPPISPMDLPRNMYQGMLCYLGIGTIDTGCHPDSSCALHAALFVNLSLLLNCIYTLCMMYILKFGSASLLYLALTAMVPIGNLAFALPFMPQMTTFHVSDLLGLGVIMSGLVLYRFADQKKKVNDIEVVSVEEQRTAALQEPLLLTGQACDV